MALSRLIYALSLISFSVAAAADDAEEIDLFFEYPAKNSVYASARTVIITGHCKNYRGGMVINLYDARNTIQQSGTCKPDPTTGAWFLYETSPSHSFFKPGEYSVEAVLALGPRRKIPITIVEDPTGPQFPIPLPSVEVGSGEFEKLPRVSFPEVQVPGLASFPKDFRAVDSGPKGELTIDVENEFAVEGRLRMPEPGDPMPGPVVLRLTTIPSDDATDKRRAIVTETLAFNSPHLDESVFNYRGVMRTPRHIGKLSLEAVYRGRIIASSPVIVSDADPVPDDAVAFDYPSPGRTYLTSSQIVIRGTAQRVSEKIHIDLLDDQDRVNSMSGVITGDEPGRQAWETRLYHDPNHVLDPGNYRIVARPEHFHHKSQPIRFVADPSGAKVPTAVQTKIGSDEYAELPRIELPRVTIQKTADEQPKVVFRGKDRQTALELPAGSEFAVEGELGLKSDTEMKPINLIVRLTMTVTDPDGKSANVTVNESLAAYDATAKGAEFPFRTVLRSSAFATSLNIETVYGQQVISSTPVKIRE